MKFQQYVTRTVKVACFLLTIMFTCLVLQQYFLRNTDNNSLRIEGYYQEEPDSLDVVFIGASDIYTSFMPGRAYEQFGFTSYLLASESITSEGVITAVKEVYRTQHPDLIVIEANTFLYGDSRNESNEAHIHKFFDNLPLSENKTEYIQKYVKPENQMEYFFPLIKYHSLWSEYPRRLNMTMSDLSLDMRGYNNLKGFSSTAQILKTDEECLNKKIANEHIEKPLNPKLEEQLNELLDYCDEKKLNVAFVRAPHYVIKDTYNRVKRSNRMETIVEERGYLYYSAENDASIIGIDEKRDFYNVDHMNVYGALKFTDYLSGLLVEEEKLNIDPLNEAQKENWAEAAKCTNQLYRYCDDVMTHTTEVKGAQEDVLTLFKLGGYSGDPIVRG